VKVYRITFNVKTASRYILFRFTRIKHSRDGKGYILFRCTFYKISKQELEKQYITVPQSCNNSPSSQQTCCSYNTVFCWFIFRKLSKRHEKPLSISHIDPKIVLSCSFLKCRDEQFYNFKYRSSLICQLYNSANKTVTNI
jgi:hypothetical protein